MCFYLSLLKNKYSSALLLGLGFMALSMRSYGQRVYADAEQHSNTINVITVPLTNITVTLTEVQNANNPVNISSFSDFSSLSSLVNLPLLNLLPTDAWQNLSFSTQQTPDPGSPTTLMFAANSALLGLANGVSIQRTYNNTTIGSEYSSSNLLSLLGGGILTNDIATEITLPSSGQAFNGLQLKVSAGLLGAAISGKYYYAFFITTPKINDTTISGCANNLTLTLQNTNTSGIEYKIYTDTSAAPIDTFDHTYILSNANLPSADSNRSYYLRAEDHNTAGKVYYSAWKTWTVTRSALPAAPGVTGDTICSGEAPVLGISPYSASFSYHAYDEPSGGTLLGSNSTNSITLPVVTAITTANKNYYVSATETATGCSSDSRTPAIVVVNALPESPEVDIQ